MKEYRTGQGIDAHRLVEGRKLILGGVEIPFEKGLEGHSDADVLAHAAADALLGAAALGDIGLHFPPGDPKYKDADSIELLRAVKDMVLEKGYKVGNIDATLILEKPKISPHVSKMRCIMAQALGVDEDKVSLKATTTEGMGFTGRGEGIACMASALVFKE